MRKLTILILAILVIPIAFSDSRADYADLQDRVDTIVEVWIGGYGIEHDSEKITAKADTILGDRVLKPPAGFSPGNPAGSGLPLNEAPFRVPTNKAAEYYAPDNSASGGFLYKDAHMPNRLHLEADFYNEDDWYGDFRYSFKDYLQIRLLPRRLYHRLDNIQLYDYAGDWPIPVDGRVYASINPLDLGINDYGLTIDIDRAKVRFKTPNFPMHIFADGEVIMKKGKKQLRFIGGTAYHNEAVKVSEAREVDQRKEEITAGINSHLGLVELEYAYMNRQFDSDVIPNDYAYTDTATAVGAVTGWATPGSQYPHNLTPELKAESHTVKAHTSHTGRIFASTTLSLLEKTNEDSKAEAKNTMYYGELFWLPASQISISTKFRHQKNESEAAEVYNKITYSPFFGPLITTAPFTAPEGVESRTNSGSVEMRVSMLSKTNLSLKYAKKEKVTTDESATEWSRPNKAINDTFELGFTNWGLPKTRLTGKIRLINNVWDSENTDYVNNDPTNTEELILGITWTISPKILAMINTHFAQDRTNNNRNLHITEPLYGSALRQNHVASISFMPNDKFTFSPTYTFMSLRQDRDLVWEDGNGAHFIDTGYSSEQLAHNISLNMLYMPTKRLDINTAIDYTITDGNYRPTYIIPDSDAVQDVQTWMIGEVNSSDTKELTLRLDTDYDIGHGFGIGMNLRYTLWEDTSFDNPSEGEFVGGLLKLSKKMLY